MELLSLDSQDKQEAKFLNRWINIGDFGITIEGDNKHASILMEEWGLTHANGVDTPLTNDMLQVSVNRPLMNDHDAKVYRRAVARVNFMAQDRCDLSAASKVMSQAMASPREGDEALIKKG